MIDVLSGITLALLGWALALYYPLRIYSAILMDSRDFSEAKWSPLLMLYIVWYVPFCILIFVGSTSSVFDLVGGNVICGCSSLLAIMWVFVGHNMIKSYPLKSISEGTESDA